MILKRERVGEGGSFVDVWRGCLDVQHTFATPVVYVKVLFESTKF